MEHFKGHGVPLWQQNKFEEHFKTCFSIKAFMLNSLKIFHPEKSHWSGRIRGCTLGKLLSILNFSI